MKRRFTPNLDTLALNILETAGLLSGWEGVITNPGAYRLTEEELIRKYSPQNVLKYEDRKRKSRG